MTISANIQKAQQAIEVSKDAAIGFTGIASATAGFLDVINGTLALLVAVLTIVAIIYRVKINRREWKDGEKERSEEE